MLGFIISVSSALDRTFLSYYCVSLRLNACPILILYPGGIDLLLHYYEFVPSLSGGISSLLCFRSFVSFDDLIISNYTSFVNTIFRIFLIIFRIYFIILHILYKLSEFSVLFKLLKQLQETYVITICLRCHFLFADFPLYLGTFFLLKRKQKSK